MRIIEPGTANERPPVKKRKSHRVILAVFGFLAVTAGIFLVFGRQADAPRSDSVSVSESASNSQQTQASTQQKLKSFTGTELKIFMDSFAYPNVAEITSKPEITGDIAADERIIKLAEDRGYMQRSVPNTSLVDVDGYLMQQKAVEDWKDLKTKARSAGLPIALSSVFRPVDEQRELFTERLKAAGATSASIAAGKSDPAVISVLKTTAVPGFSKHHTGYTIDLTCGGVGLEGFIGTSCYKWLAANNHENAKLSGWIPSYPDGAGLQGPDPEPWEYVWVGKRSLLE